MKRRRELFKRRKSRKRTGKKRGERITKKEGKSRKKTE